VRSLPSDQGDSIETEEEIRDIHGAGYPPALEAGVQSVMASFSSWQGKKLTGHKGLLTDVLKGQMGFDGFIVGDWNAHGQLDSCTNTDCPEALHAGLDMFMAPDSWKGLFDTTLKQAQDGEIDLARLDDAVRRILRVKLRAGLFEAGKPSTRGVAGQYDLLQDPASKAVARQAVKESLVYAEFKGDIDTLAYKPGDDSDLDLLKKFQTDGIPTVAVFLSGRAMWMNREINASNAFVAAWLPGSEGGYAMDVLFGQNDAGEAVDFKGKLSYSWPRTAIQSSREYSDIRIYRSRAF